MFGTFRKHSKWLWGVIIAAMAVSLVFWTGNGGNRSDGRSGGDFGTIEGRKITAEAFYDALNEVRLQYYFNQGEWPDGNAKQQGFDIEVETYKRLFLIQKQEELGIHVGNTEVARIAALNLSALAPKTGGATMTDFANTILRQGNMKIGDFERFLRHSLGMAQLVNAVGVSGQLVTPQEAKSLYERENQDLEVQAAFFNATNFLNSVIVTPAALSDFYTNQMVNYRLPDRVQVAYVAFEVTNYWAEAGAELDKMTNMNALLEEEYQKRGTNFYSGMTPELAKASIQNELHEQRALFAARKHANEFADPLLSQEKQKAGDLAAYAQKAGLVTKISPAFDRSMAPAGMKVPESFIRAAFALRDDEPILGPIIGNDAVYMIAQHKMIPSEVPAFEAVTDRVESDYRMSQAVQTARTSAAIFAQSVSNNLALGKPFASLCSEARGMPVQPPAFSLSTRSLSEVEPFVSLQQFKQVAFATSVGQTSTMVPTMDGGMVLHVKSKLPIDQTKLDAELPTFTKMLRQARQSEAFNEWFSREAQSALANTPIAQPRPSELNQPASSEN